MLVTSYSTTLYVWLLALEEDQDKNESVRFVSKILQASKGNITTILYDDVSSWIVTGDQQGNVIARESASPEVVTMRMSGAHAGPVTRLVAHPTMCGFASYSPSSPLSTSGSNESSNNKREMDVSGGRLQVWSCNFRGPLEALDDLGQLCALVTNKSAASLISLSPTKLIYLAMHQLYCFFAPLTSPAKRMSSTENMTYQRKVVVASEDNSVRVFSPKGSQLNVQILPSKDSIEVIHALFAGHKNQLFTIILKSGEILVSDSGARPMKFRKVFLNDGPLITCFATYEYFDEIHDHDRRPKKPRVFYPTSTLIFVGTDEGNIVLVNVDDGKREGKCLAHEGSVMQLKSSVASQRMVSLGQEKCVKVWRVFADLSQPLALYYAIYFVEPISHIASMGDILCISKSSQKSKQHQVVMENMTDRVRLIHSSDVDHAARITEMITSETLHICVTSSLDKTIRVWDQENSLSKTLEINLCVEIITFSSDAGDIIFGKGRHLYKIPHESYLPPKYRAKIVSDDLEDDEEDEVFDEDLGYKIYEDVVDRQLMLHPVISIPMASLDTTNADVPQVDLLIRKQMCSLYEVRDEDIRKIRDSLLKSLTKGKSGNRALMTAEEWRAHMNDLLKSMTRQAPQIPAYDFYGIQKTQSIEKKIYNDRGMFFMLFGYNPDQFDNPEYLRKVVKDTKLPLHGFLPNSVLYKLKEEEKPVVLVKEPVVREIVRYRYPPEFYPQEEDTTQKRKSIRLSQLLGLDDTGEEGET
ncbi:hypothetical protein QAD02_017111 [Eretmocerus hayati]|uniref:Uncharacterized protein n=1 Tax=Eretmocerus hayati TaxID=131215 RepID=A0ACC2PCH5_9HYME|nr:hypothetical protein QAD02_017111 [Eretmocerus hayati]